MTFSEVLTGSEAVLQQPLKTIGFQKGGVSGTWYRQRGDDLNVICLQKNSSAESFCVNLGIHYSFLPAAGTESSLVSEAVELPDCEIKLRLTAHDSAKDQWWPFSPESVREITDLITTRGMAIFDSYRLGGPIATMEPKIIERGDSGLLSSLTKVRACLLLARIYERLGNPEKCIEAASLGLRLAGMAIGPKKALKEILNRNVHPT